MAKVTLTPGSSIQAAINQNPVGTEFYLQAGTYRGQQFTPKDGQIFVGAPGAVINGSIELKGWAQSGSAWKVGGLPAQLPPAGVGSGGSTLPTLREDLFVNDQLYKRVGSIGELKDGTWYFDKATQSAYLSKNPGTAKVEMSATPYAIKSEATGVVLKDIVVEKYASAAQTGAIQVNGANWVLENVTARDNHGGGATLGKGTLVTGGHFNHNGQVGIGAWKADGAKIVGAEVAYNNYANFERFWDAGGLKITELTGFQVLNSYIHDNKAVGLWFDIDMKNVLVAGNVISQNDGVGISYEISFDATIRDNTVIRNGLTAPGQIAWLPSAQIGIQNSSNVNVHNNTIEAKNGQGGIALLHENRGGGKYGEWTTKNNSIHDNKITYLGTEVLSGFQVNYQTEASKGFGNTWNGNTWIMPDGSKPAWMFNSALSGFDAIQKAYGFETTGHLTVAQASPSPIVPPAAVDTSNPTPVPAPVPAPGPTPVPEPTVPPVIGSGPDTVVVRASGDSYQGSPAFKLLVDGVVKAGPVNVTAKHGAGWQDFTFKLDVADAAKKVSVDFFNDFSNGPGLDRNMYVDSISFNGTKLAVDKAALYSNGSSTATLPATSGPAPTPTPIPAPKPPVIGSGPDTVVVRASGDSYKGDPSFKLMVDGVAKSGPVNVTTKHGAGWQEFTFKLDVPDAAKKVSVNFFNDFSDGPGLDRNMYVDSISFNGAKLAVDKAALYSNGSSTATLPATPAASPVPAPTSPVIGSGPDTVVVRASGTATRALRRSSCWSMAWSRPDRSMSRSSTGPAGRTSPSSSTFPAPRRPWPWASPTTSPTVPAWTATSMSTASMSTATTWCPRRER